MLLMIMLIYADAATPRDIIQRDIDVYCYDARC